MALMEAVRLLSSRAGTKGAFRRRERPELVLEQGSLRKDDRYTVCRAAHCHNAADIPHPHTPNEIQMSLLPLQRRRL